MNQDSHVTQRLTEAQEKPIHRAQSNMVWDLVWFGEDTGKKGDPIKIFRAAQFETLRHAQEYASELAARYNLVRYTLTRI